MAEIPIKLLDYKLHTLIGKGGYGKVFKGTNLKTSQEIAIKLSPVKEKLYKEYNFLNDLQHCNDFPKIYDYQEFPDQDALIMELLGRNLSFYAKETPLSLNCICAIGIKLLSSIEKMHETGILHRDLKPGNFVTSLDLKHLKIVDFGIANYYMVGNHHKEFKTRRKCRGTPTFASINNHLGFRQSRRDDIECLAYTLMYLLTGTLPWKTELRATGFNKWKCLLSQKITASKSTWFKNLPPELLMLLQYSRKLTYEQAPNYCYLKTLFCRYVHLNHLYSYFDWYDIKNDTNLGTSQQIVEGATIITKLERERKNPRLIEKTHKISFDRRKESKNFRVYMKLCKSQDISNENYDRSEKQRKKQKKSVKIMKGLKKNQFLQLPSYDNIILINHQKIEDGSVIKRVRSQVTIECSHLQTSTSQVVDENNDFLEKVRISSLEVKQDESPQTPKSGFPEFKNKLIALKTKNHFLAVDDKHKTDCLIF